MTQDDFRRYDRQIRFKPIGEPGQRAIQKTTVLVVGCGALGSVAADQLARAGVKRLTVVDRDVVDLHNLHRQPLFTEKDLADGLPKAIAAERALRAANSAVQITGLVEDFNCRNALALSEDADLIIDGSDNFETRFLINDVALERGIPWIYGGAIRGDGVVKAISPGKTSCLHCIVDSIPEPGEAPTCETDGIIAPAPHVVASLQVSLAMRLLVGDEVPGDLLFIDCWNPGLRAVSAPRLENCPACVSGHRRYLSGEEAGSATVVCGRDTVQVLPASEGKLDLDVLKEKLSGLGEISHRRFYLFLNDGKLQLSIFPDGRVLVKGTGDPALARAAVARYLGG